MLKRIYIEDEPEIPMNDHKNNNLTIIIPIIIGVVILLTFLLYKYFAPFGKVVSYTFTSKLPGSKEATTFPNSPNSSLIIPSQIIQTSQVRFSVNLLSQKIDSIHAKLRFKKNTKEIKIGVRGNETDGFTYLPLYQSQLQDLAWTQITESNFTLWQKEKKFSTLGDFIRNVGPEKITAAYFVEADKLSLLKPSEPPKDVTTVLNSQLRGTHILLIRVDKAPLVLKVTKRDLNVYEGEDKVKVVVSKDGKMTAEQTIEDDGITTASNLKMQQQESVITIKDINPGLYQVDLIAEGNGSDSIITKIEINQQKIIIKNYFYTLGNTPTSFWTNANKLTITTWHPESLQTVKLNGDTDLKITEINKKYTFDLKQLSRTKSASPLFQLEFPKNDLVVDYDGYITLNKDNYFDPNIIRSVPLTSLDTLDDVDYFLTTYQKAKPDGDWMVAEATFDPNKIKITGDKLYFTLEMPDIAKSGGELEIDSLEIEVKSDGVLSKTEKGKKEETKVASASGKKTNAFSRFFGWIGEKIEGVKKFISGITFKFPNKKTAKSSPTPTPTIKLSITPTATTTATASATSYDLLIRVLNGGAEKGAAGSVSATLKTGGFTKVNAGNADRTDYTGVTIQYRKEDLSIADKIEALLKKDYGSVTKTLSATNTAEAVIILGKK